MEKRSRKKDKNKENVVASAVEKEKKKAGITELDFKQLRICLQQILNKINGLMLPLIKNCKNDKAAMFLSCLATDICVGLSSWVDADNDKGYEENADKVELQHLFASHPLYSSGKIKDGCNATLHTTEQRRKESPS